MSMRCRTECGYECRARRVRLRMPCTPFEVYPVVVRTAIVALLKLVLPALITLPVPANRLHIAGHSGLRSADDNDVTHGFGFPHAGGRGAPADEFAGGRPHGDMLVTGGVVVSDERHLADADGKQVEPPWNRAPPQAASHLLGIAALHGQVRLSA